MKVFGVVLVWFWMLADISIRRDVGILARYLDDCHPDGRLCGRDLIGMRACRVRVSKEQMLA